MLVSNSSPAGRFFAAKYTASNMKFRTPEGNCGLFLRANFITIHKDISPIMHERRGRLSYFGCFSDSQDIVTGRISPNLASLRPSVPFVLPNFIDIC